MATRGHCLIQITNYNVSYILAIILKNTKRKKLQPVHVQLVMVFLSNINKLMLLFFFSTAFWVILFLNSEPLNVSSYQWTLSGKVRGAIPNSDMCNILMDSFNFNNKHNPWILQRSTVSTFALTFSLNTCTAWDVSSLSVFFTAVVKKKNPHLNFKHFLSLYY